MATKSVIKTARDVLDRFYRDAEGRTNRQIDVYFTLEDMRIAKDKAEPAIEYLVSRGLVNSFGTDIAFLTDAGVKAVKDDADIETIPKVVRDFEVAKPAQSGAAAERTASGGGTTAPPAGRARPKKPFLMHITAEGEEFALPLGWSCTIGRQEGNEVKVNDQRASKRHAEIFYKDNAYYLRDLNSANGTLLNGDYVVEEMLLKHDDEVVIGRTMILFQTPAIIPQPPGPSPADQASDEATVIPPAEPEVPLAATERPAEAEAEAKAEPDEPAAIRVVRGRPAPAPKKPEVRPDLMPTPAEDLFAEPKRPSSKGKTEPEDLFAEPSRKKKSSEDLFEAPSNRRTSDDDLFADSAKTKEPDDLFAKPKAQPPPDLFSEPKKRGSDPDLLGRPSSRAKTALAQPEPKRASADDDLFSGTLPPRIDSSARLVAELTSQPPTTSPEHAEEILQELEPLPLDAIDAPIQEVSAEAPGSWEEQTPTDGALENPPVTTLRDDEDEEDKSEATVMTSRGDLYRSGAIEDKGIEELPTWGESPLPSASVEAGPGPKAGFSLYGEDLPEAAVSLINLQAVPREGSETGIQDVEAFRRTLEALRDHAERADLPDRTEILGAIDLLKDHPYIRVALKLLA